MLLPLLMLHIKPIRSASRQLVRIRCQRQMTRRIVNRDYDGWLNVHQCSWNNDLYTIVFYCLSYGPNGALVDFMKVAHLRQKPGQE